jgi:hypothetical protein
VQKVLSEEEWLNKMQPEDYQELTPLFYGHITPYGEFQLDMNKRIILKKQSKSSNGPRMQQRGY